MLANEVYSFFMDREEYYGAGYYEEPYKSPFERFSRALRRYFENYSLPEYKGEPLYPFGYGNPPSSPRIPVLPGHG